MMWYKLDDNHHPEPCSPSEWETLNRKVAKSTGEDLWVSTVFLGLDHSFGEPGGPILFETMVFPLDSYSEKDCERYRTWDEAVEGHRRLCKKWGVPE